MTPVAACTFRFDRDNHEYIDLATWAVLPHITGMLEQTGWVDTTWLTEEGRDRGTAIHALTADHDLGAVTLEDVPADYRYRKYFLAYLSAMSILRPTILKIETAMVHPVYLFGGRPDRLVRLFKELGPFEIKTGPLAKSHGIQTALQAILESTESDLPPEAHGRWGLYLKPNGKFSVHQFKDRRDFDEAYRVVKECCK